MEDLSSKKDGGQRLSDAEEKEFNRLSPQHGESSGATTPKVLQFLELAYQFSELRPLPDELSAEPLSLIPPPGLRNHWVVEFKQDVKVEDLIKRIVKAHNGTATPSARHEINMEAADTEELERLRNLAPKNQLSAWGKECLKMLTQVPAGEKNHMKKDSSADGAKKFVHKGEINKPTDRYKARLGGVDGVLPPGFSEASTHTLSMVDKVGDSGGAEVSLVVNAPTGEVTSDLFQISMAPSPGAASAPPVSTQQSGAKKAAALLNDFGLFSSTSSAFIIGAEGYYNFNKTDFERSDNPRFKALGDELAALISGYSEDCKTNVTEQQEQIRKKIEEIEDVKSVLQLLKNMLIAGQQPLPIAEEEQNSQKKSEMG